MTGENSKEIPLLIYDSHKNKKYKKGRFLGKGSFAHCYEFKDIDTKKILAIKVFFKSNIKDENQRKNIYQEVSIQKSLDHINILRIYNCFEDINNIYMILDVCKNKSLMELHIRRKTVTEPEAKYFLKQLVSGMSYLHKNMIIHRDLKLANLLLDEKMDIKIGDFGLAAKLLSKDEKRRSLCGTPNYVAPEILLRIDYSFEVDIWSIGCVLYTLLVGKPPFECSSVKGTYSNIKNNYYTIPSTVNKKAQFLIRNLLHPEPSRRPLIDQILSYDFLKYGYIPSRLPVSCLTMEPKFEYLLKPSNNKLNNVMTRTNEEPLSSCHEKRTSNDKNNDNLRNLYRQLQDLLSKNIKNISGNLMDETLHPASSPVYFVSKWADYTEKYGLGYQLSDNSIGILFKDDTRIIVDAANSQIQYFDYDNKEFYFTRTTYPEHLTKKVKLIELFKNYMMNHLIRAADPMPKDGDEFARLPVLKTWIRNEVAIILYLSNGTLQCNFFDDHVKIILCPYMKAVTVIDSEKNLKTYKFKLISEFGCVPDILTKLKFIKETIYKMIRPKRKYIETNFVNNDDSDEMLLNYLIPTKNRKIEY
uniref:Serine/threonine-protein kinase PLK n=1 Tax=Parastrongyloides trichosuri TaxID=131310 RepID=A0A0N4ZMJ4_PARTI